MFIIFAAVAFTFFVHVCGEVITAIRKERLDSEWEAAEDDYLLRTLALEIEYDKLGVPSPQDFDS
ncbi:hypothetical protein [Nitrosomonas marina]|uniref:Uncharacterized protein n=1 Tax=Nitrosomonas marina TaxID=917 RepID=A0A1H8G001_9PROT|nr:hypothetical protein [Nitrosomonas marina]SEN37421.1 hypothetical protein SAMN05216325_11578 [Nitrosomonas marina]